jgi:hypothetical protein
MDLTHGAAVLALLASTLSVSCSSSCRVPEATVAFTRLPPYAAGSAGELYGIEGRASGARPGEKIVIYAKSGLWWVQPFADHPLTPLGPDSVWKTRTHPGLAYAALLVKAGFQPHPKLDVLPERSNAVLAIATAERKKAPNPVEKTLFFGGYEWVIRQTPGQPGGTHNVYDPANAWTDPGGHLHLLISGHTDNWTSAEINLTRSLGYGSYRFVVRDLAHLEPSVVFAMLTSDDGASLNEMDIEISRWGETTGKNGQFVIQPYFIPANTVRFQVPTGIATFMLRWSPGRASFKAFSGANSRWESSAVREHVFTSGVPAPATESVHLNLYVFGKNRNPLQQESEVVVEAFEYLP